MGNLARMNLFIAERGINVPPYINVYTSRGEAEFSNVNGIDLITASARESDAKLESTSGISASQMML
ncbi:hypothetical protein M405DRAFT_811443 [Rhizopogon salebrosus TDB-379]|nr:hypothetical protein M405DRAFT_811443 [Rhizopogon salebrosus TDB-379]